MEGILRSFMLFMYSLLLFILRCVPHLGQHSLIPYVPSRLVIPIRDAPFMPQHSHSSQSPTNRRFVYWFLRFLSVLGLLFGASDMALRYMTLGSRVYAQSYTTHHVQPGENLYTIAARYGVTVQAIVGTNSIPNPNNIRVGQPLRIPTNAVSRTVVLTPTPWATKKPEPSLAHSPPTVYHATPMPTRPAYVNDVSSCGGMTRGEWQYIVRAGDTLFGIARSVGMSVLDLRQRNYLSSNVIRVGQCLIIPAAGRLVAPTAPDRRRGSEHPSVTPTAAPTLTPMPTLDSWPTADSAMSTTPIRQSMP